MNQFEIPTVASLAFPMEGVILYSNRLVQWEQFEWDTLTVALDDSMRFLGMSGRLPHCHLVHRYEEGE